ncbi:hypothetical protein BGW39_010553 [Mortierella sp. 14UC]|nr:hypothetical protein BGW39_010553 [Mortierella sp. 14UC]
MQIVQEPSPGKPLDLPEIRTRIASFLSRKDCVSCMRVSRDWFFDFAPCVWHTIDFGNYSTAFSSLATNVLDKYASFISQTLNITELSHIQALQHYKVDSIQSMKVYLQETWQ